MVHILCMLMVVVLPPAVLVLVLVVVLVPGLVLRQRLPVLTAACIPQGQVQASLVVVPVCMVGRGTLLAAVHLPWQLGQLATARTRMRT